MIPDIPQRFDVESFFSNFDFGVNFFKKCCFNLGFDIELELLLL